MGSDSLPFMADLLLYYFENKWILNLKKPNCIRTVVPLKQFLLMMSYAQLMTTVYFENVCKKSERI